MAILLGCILASVGAGFLIRAFFASGARYPVIAVEGIDVRWKDPGQMEVAVFGEVRKAEPQRLLMEVVLCDGEGARLPAKDSALADKALGVMQVFDVSETPQTFKRRIVLPVPEGVPGGYVAVTFFQNGNLLVAHQNSGFWPERPAKDTNTRKHKDEGQ